MTEQELIELAWVKGRENTCGAVMLFCMRDPSRKDKGWSSTYHAAYGAHTDVRHVPAFCCLRALA